MFAEWLDYLHEADQQTMLVRRAKSAGGIDLLNTDLDIAPWTRLVTGGLSQGVTAYPLETL